MKIYVSRDYKKTLCIFILYFTMFVGFFLFNFGLPNSSLYLCDAIMLFLMLILARRNAKVLKKNSVIAFLIPLIILVTLGSICAIFNGFSIARWIWSIRNWGRLFAFFVICLAVLEKRDGDRICRFTLNLYKLNIIIVFVQFLLMQGISRDALNGLFGRETSSVHLTMTFVVVAIATAQYVAEKIDFKKFLILMVGIFVIAVIAELRIIPIIVPIIIAIAFFSTFRMSVRSLGKVAMFIGIACIFIAGATHFLKLFYPDTALDFTISNIIKAASTQGGYGFTGGIDRLTFLSVINESVFTNWQTRLFGLGIGNAEYSAVTSLCSPFYNSYGKFLRYLNFSSAMLYIETGIIGLCLYFVSFLAVLFWFLRLARNNIKRKSDKAALFYSVLGVEIAVINLIFIIYNNLQRTDVSYLLGLYLAIAFIGARGGNSYEE